jgi:hypothetical protein
MHSVGAVAHEHVEGPARIAGDSSARSCGSDVAPSADIETPV